MEALAARIKRDIVRGSFDYGAYFPNSPRAKPAIAPARQDAPSQGLPTADFVEAPTFAQASDAWFAENQPRWRSTNAETTRSILDRRILPALGQTAASEITRADLLAFRAATMQQSTRGSRPLSASRVNHIMGVARMVLETRENQQSRA